MEKRLLKWGCRLKSMKNRGKQHTPTILHVIEATPIYSVRKKKVKLKIKQKSMFEGKDEAILCRNP